MFVPGIIAPEQAGDRDLCFVFQGNELLVVSAGESARLPSRGELPAPAASPAHYLGRLGEAHCYTGEWPGEVVAGDGMEWLGLRRLFGRVDDTTLAVAGRAFQILQWDSTHRFCGRCGTPTERHASERSRVCPRCALLHYPRLSPAVMALVRRDDELLLARSPHFPEGMYSALAGFVEPGESLEETVVREVREEVGVEIANLRYFGSQPWPFPHSLMIAFVADYVSGDIVPQPGEIEAADWFTIGHLPRLPHRMSIARRLIDATLVEMGGLAAAAGRDQ